VSEAASRGRERRPNFLLIGAAKAGTTALWSYLAQHPDIYLTENKEPNYFAFPGGPPNCRGPAPPEVVHELLLKFSVTDWDEYLALFRGRTEPALGEASVRYLYVPEAAQRIHARLPDVRLIAVLREPVARLHSHYWMNRQFHLEDLSLDDALAAEEERTAAGWGYDWHYVGVGRYAAQVERYFRLFGRERVAVFLQDELRVDASEVVRRASRFLGVSDSFEADVNQRVKEGYRPRLESLDRLLYYPNPARSLGFRVLGPERFQALRTRLRRWNAAPVPPLEQRRRAQLAERFQDDVARLEDLLGRDLSAWR
jgi:hypothetical protein